MSCFAPEIELRAEQPTTSTPPSGRPSKGHAGHRLRSRADEVLGRLPTAITDWRARAWAKAGLVPGIALTASSSPPVALPSDALLLGLQGPENSSSSPHDDGLNFSLTHDRRLLASRATAAERTGADLPSLLARRSLLGRDGDIEGVPARFTSQDVELLILRSRDFSTWLRTEKPVPMGHVLAMADMLKSPPRLIRDRLERLGYRVPDADHVPEAAVVSDDDLTILSRRLDGVYPWLSPADEVPVSHLLTAAAVTERPPGRSPTAWRNSATARSTVLARIRPGRSPSGPPTDAC
ncbi:hypothetical protein [Actinacidiphila sp. ITFR-21]|uniref:wHTH domain-containing protein n=1 Tax=Actinacidiphila sp. ITFR-21 TaxID=3075199 RepID=UPI002889B890|nr:hypothetical protein [Streptomyces sp. ITFR-21]WNI14826.1 hypothetical protein RLT57_04260 [Streptomyces sp. ITFR-21]